MNMQDATETRRWGTILRRCGLNHHPRTLSAEDERLQYMILSAASDHPNRLPKRSRWERWYSWSLQQKRDGYA